MFPISKKHLRRVEVIEAHLPKRSEQPCRLWHKESSQSTVFWNPLCYYCRNFVSGAVRCSRVTTLSYCTAKQYDTPVCFATCMLLQKTSMMLFTSCMGCVSADAVYQLYGLCKSKYACASCCCMGNQLYNQYATEDIKWRLSHTILVLCMMVCLLVQLLEII